MESSDMSSNDEQDEQDEQFADPAMEALFPVIEWLSEPNPREQRRFLEQHPELLNPGTEKVLKLLLAIMDERPDELRQLTQVNEDQVTALFERYRGLLAILGSIGGIEMLTEGRDNCRNCLKVLRALNASEASVEVIQATYVNLFSGLSLDAPSWLEQSIRQFFVDQQTVALAPKEQADSWLAFIQRASQDKQVPPEFIAALWHERAIAFLEDTGVTRADRIHQAITAWENALQVFTPDRYPLQYAQFQTYMAQAYAKSEGKEKRKNAELAIQAGQKALELLTSVASPENRAETLVTLGISYLSRTEAHYTDADCEQAIQYFEEALTFFTHATFPEQWAECQLYSGVACELLVTNGHMQYQELALSHFQAALQVYTRDTLPERWAMTHMYLGMVCRRSAAKGATQRRIDALDHFLQALGVYTRDAFPEQWARLQMSSGDLYAEEPGTENFHAARNYYEAALEIFTRDRYPMEWARCCDSLGNLYAGLMKERDSTQREQAIHYFEDALQIYRRDDDPHTWAALQTHLGNAYRLRLQGEKNENIKYAIHLYTNALEVFAEDTSSPEWANTQNALAMAYKDIAGDEAFNLEQAIAACEAALQVYTRNAYPEQWAGTQHNLGLLFARRKRGIEGDNLERAIQHLRAALQVYTQDTYPREWAMTQRNLGLTYSFRVQGERSDNVERAIYYTRATLAIYTLEEFPQDWIGVQLALARLYNDRIWGDKQENQEQALSACQMALPAMSRDTYLVEWVTTQRTLGDIYEKRLAGNRRENLELAAAYYEAALQTYALESSPEDYRIIHLVLARIRGYQGNWQAVHEAYVQARKAEDILIRLGIGLVGQHLAIGRGREGRDAGARNGFALIRLGKVEEGLMAIERGQARIMAATQTMNVADPLQITNSELRKRYTQARQSYIEAQAVLNAPLPPALPESERRRQDIARNEAFYKTQAALNSVIEEIRNAHDPVDFLKDSLSMKTIINAAACGGAGHALVYLTATPWGGLAIAIYGADTNQPEIATFDLPDLFDDTIHDFLAVRLTEEDKPVIGGFSYAQENVGFVLLVRDWRGLSFQGYAESLHDTCIMEGKAGLLDQAAQDILTSPDVTHLVAQPLYSLKRADFFLLMNMLDKRFLQLELQRILETLSKAGIPELVQWLVEREVKSLTLVPCGWLATLPLTAVPCADGRSLGEILPTSVTPNASALLQAGDPVKKVRSGVYTLGDPHTNQKPLPWSEAEALTIAKLARKQQQLGKVDVKVGSDAKRSWLVDALEQGFVVVASCHGRFDRNDFLQSTLLLAGGQKLTLADMLSHQVDLRGLRLIILSACQTASAEMQGAAANEVKSLAASMVQAGAMAVLATLWPVDDRATYLLMVRFAQEWLPNMASEPPSAALGRAQHWLRSVTNRELQYWEANELSPISLEEKQEAGAGETEEVVEKTAQPLKEDTVRTISDMITEGTSSYRYDMEDAQKFIRFEAKERNPDACPYADPIYWAGFQITGW